eukprot:g628.t1 g628   contig10:421011-421601(+)
MISLLLLQQLLGCPTESLAFASTRSSPLAARSNANNVLERQSIGPLSMAGGEGGEAEWVKALMEAGGGNNPGQFEEDMKMKGLLGPNRGAGNPKLNANSRLIAWLESEGGCTSLNHPRGEKHPILWLLVPKLWMRLPMRVQDGGCWHEGLSMTETSC